MKINLKIITPEKIAYEGGADQITIPTQDGEITVLANHVPLISSMKHGELIIKNDGKETYLAIYGGFIEVRKNEIKIMTDIAERIAEIDEKKAEEARRKAEEILKNKDMISDVAFADATAALEKSLARLKVARRKKR